jgi:hypothetical protein
MMVLSDGTLEMCGNNARLKMKQKDKEFVHHIWDHFNEIGIVGAEPKETSQFRKGHGSKLASLRVQNLHSPLLNRLKKTMVPKGGRKKC